MTTADSGAPATGTPDATDATGQTGAPPATDDAKDWKAEHDKLLVNSRKWEERAKANADAVKQLDALKQQSMTDQEKAVADAVAATKQDTLREVAGKLVDAEIRAAAAGRNLDVDALLDGIDRSRFLGDDLDPDRTAITGWLDKVAPRGDDKPAAPDLGQGARGGPPALNSSQLERDLKKALGVG